MLNAQVDPVGYMDRPGGGWRGALDLSETSMTPKSPLNILFSVIGRLPRNEQYSRARCNLVVKVVESALASCGHVVTSRMALMGQELPQAGAANP